MATRANLEGMTIAYTDVPSLLRDEFPELGVAKPRPEDDPHAILQQSLGNAIVAAARSDAQPQDDPFLAQAFAFIERVAVDGDRLCRDLVQEAICEKLDHDLHREPGHLAACLELMGPQTRSLMEQLLRGPI